MSVGEDLRLPDQSWLHDPAFMAVVAMFRPARPASGPLPARLVGGAVRDALLGLSVQDQDFATPLAPDRVAALARQAGLKAVPTGLAHGTLTIVSHGKPFEITTLRRDVTTDGRHAEVAFTDDWQADAARRDFTINALYADPETLELFDFNGGLADLQSRTVRFIGEPATRIAEDHLRILRFFRFHARFGVGEPDPAGLSACIAARNSLMALSRERIRDEMFKLLATDNPLPTLQVMLDGGILAPVLPEVPGPDGLRRTSRLVAIEGELGLRDPLRRLAALLPLDGTLAATMSNRLRLSNLQRARLLSMADLPDALPVTGAPLRAWRYAQPSAQVAQDRVLLAALQASDAQPLLTELAGWTAPRLPVGGRDLIALGVPKGPQVSALLQQVEAAWVAADFPSDPQSILKLAERVVQQATENTP